jgi:hypothetical protein
MEAKKFRIGNLILIHDCLQEIVELPLPENCTDENTKGIPLTKEWLLRFGFENNSFDNYCYLHFNPRMSIRFCDFNSAECDITQDDKYISFKCAHIKHVHELQNLFFVLSGNELEIKQDVSACS